MMHKLFAVRDSKAEAYLQPFFSQTLGTALRAITDATNDLQHVFHRYAEDYDLYLLGEFDDETAKFNLRETPEHVTKLVHLITPATSPPLLEAMERA